KAFAAIRKGAVARQDDAVGGDHVGRIARDAHLDARADTGPGDGKGLGRRAQIACAVVDDSDDHRGRSSAKRRALPLSRGMPGTVAGRADGTRPGARRSSDEKKRISASSGLRATTEATCSKPLRLRLHWRSPGPSMPNRAA